MATNGPPPETTGDDPEHFRPTGTIFILGIFVLALILLWISVYVILLSRGVTT
jgi:hypothetical protein